MPSAETIALDPVEFIPARVQVGLDELGINVVDAEWGDSEHELFLVRQELGEVPADRHPPNRQVIIKLQARKEFAVSLAEAAQRLQMKVGILQKKGGWVRRDFDPSGQFATSVGAIVYGAALGGIQGWMFTHRQAANEITLTLTIGPYFYGTKELETETFQEKVQRALIYKVAKYKGTAPGIKRVSITNLGTHNWLSTVGGWESEDYSAANTAALHYLGKELTKLGKSTISGNGIRRSGVTKNWIAMLHSKITAAGQMSHIGNRKMLFRVEGTEKVELRLEYRVLSAPFWTINDPVVISAGASIIDLGIARLEEATLGGQMWEFRVAINKGASETFSEAIVLDVWPFPTEQYAKVASPPHYVTPAVINNEDAFEQAAGALNGKVLGDASATWETKGEGEDYKVTETTPPHALVRVTTEANGTKIARPGPAAYPIIACQCDVYINERPPEVSIGSLGGFIFAGIGYSNLETGNGFGRWFNWQGSGVGGKANGPYEDYLLFFGRFYKVQWTPGTWYTFTYFAIGAQYAVGWIQPRGSTAPLGPPEFISSITTPEGSPTIWDNGVGFAQAKNNAYRAYDNFRAWVPDLNAVAFAGKGLELRSDGAFRQDSVENAWGKLVPDGFLPTAVPSLLESVPTRGIILPSQGDMESINDFGTNEIQVVEHYFPGYHFASESS